MKKIVFAVIYMALTGVSAADVDDSLEPCINGYVSASGNYASQIQEDKQKYALGHELEPCINSGVSASGSYASQEIEYHERHRVRIAGK